MPVIRQAVEVILFENPDLRTDVCAERSPMILALALDKSMAKTEIEDKIPVLKGGFVADARKYGLFGHHSSHDFCLNFFVPLLMESGFSVSREAIDRLEANLELLPHEEQEYILEHLNTPRPLKLCCRDILRKTYKGQQIHTFVMETEMPDRLKDYILLKTFLKCIPEDRISRCTIPLPKFMSPNSTDNEQ